MSEVDKLLDGINGSRAPGAKLGHHMKCDSCDETVFPNNDIALYASNWEILDRIDEGQFVKVFRAYCPDCKRKHFLMPMEGAVELMIYCRLDEEKYYRDSEIVAYSGPDDGTPWNPREVVDWFFPEPVELAVAQMAGMDMGPEDVVEMLLHYNLDPREVVDDEGNLIDNEETREMRAEAIIEKAEKATPEMAKALLKRFERVQEYDYSMGGFGGTKEQNKASEERREE
jgi:hypothetical protein